MLKSSQKSWSCAMEIPRGIFRWFADPKLVAKAPYSAGFNLSWARFLSTKSIKLKYKFNKKGSSIYFCINLVLFGYSRQLTICIIPIFPLKNSIVWLGFVWASSKLLTFVWRLIWLEMNLMSSLRDDRILIWRHVVIGWSIFNSLQNIVFIVKQFI